MSTYSLDAEKFISEVRSHRELWDVDEAGKAFKNTTKERAWCDVARVFIRDFDSLTALEQAEVHRKLYNKWRNIRDAYVRNVRSTRVNKSGSYIFMKQLSFLDALYRRKRARSRDRSDGHSTDDERTVNDNSCEADSDEPALVDNVKRRRTPSKKKKKIKITNNTQVAATPESSEKEEKKEMKWQNIELIDPALSAMQYPEYDNPIAMPRVNDDISATDGIAVSSAFDEDRSFFDSLLPAVREFDMDQKLKFRFEVLRVIKDIRSGDRASCKPEPSSSYYVE